MILPPLSRTSTWRFASYSIAAITKRTELTFFVSVRVPSSSPGLRTETLTSARIEPSSILPSHDPTRSEEHTSELQSLMRISYAVFCLKKKNTTTDMKQSAIRHCRTTHRNKEYEHAERNLQ